MRYFLPLDRDCEQRYAKLHRVTRVSGMCTSVPIPSRSDYIKGNPRAQESYLQTGSRPLEAI